VGSGESVVIRTGRRAQTLTDLNVRRCLRAITTTRLRCEHSAALTHGSLTPVLCFTSSFTCLCTASNQCQYCGTTLPFYSDLTLACSATLLARTFSPAQIVSTQSKRHSGYTRVRAYAFFSVLEPQDTPRRPISRPTARFVTTQRSVVFH